MDKLKLKLEKLKKAFQTLEESYTKYQEINSHHFFYKEIRDSVIKRFEYTIDYFWKVLKLYLEKKHALITEVSPKKIFRQAEESGTITKKEYKTLINMITDRNNTSHMHKEEVSESIVDDMQNYITTLEDIIQKMQL